MLVLKLFRMRLETSFTASLPLRAWKTVRRSILQAHMDMVPQKNRDTQHDFENDPIQVYVDGEWVKAKGTTLGSDNGMGVAAIMAVMEDKTLKDGPLVALITADEETGMYGAFRLENWRNRRRDFAEPRYLEEGELYIGCAGGEDRQLHWNIRKKKPIRKM